MQNCTPRRIWAVRVRKRCILTMQKRAGVSGEARIGCIHESALDLLSGKERLGRRAIDLRLGAVFGPRPACLEFQHGDAIVRGDEAIDRASYEPAAGEHRKAGPLKAERSERFVPLARSLAENEEELAIIAMLLDDYYQQSLHAVLPPPAAETPAPEARRPSAERGRRRRN